MTVVAQSEVPDAVAGGSGRFAVELDGVVKRFGAVTAVDGISLRIRPGEVVALLGPNGAGKTSTVDMLLGLSAPTSGTARVYGRPPQEAVALGLVSAVMQTGGLLKDYTVEETVRLTAVLFGRGRAEVGRVLERAGIADIGSRLVGKCSGGQQQRLRFAMALLPDPELLILDEPTTGMDVGGRRDFWTSIREDARGGRTVIFATHYLEEADAYADRVVFVRRGRLVADGTAAQVKALASGRTLRATLPGADEAALLALPGVDSVEVRGDTVLVQARDTDEVARHLLTATAARDLEITSRNLEQAFLTLTADENQGSGE
ncbi:ABC transporter ATP-binding protein [Amorphoplanes digitatis]|uniref:ABC-2 type transport system ATP-binding protein n=1 Tax=Actinoplanes digitatis TaxID=1868 RepID=A0A7W7MRD1_9ACTN|nr:ABC transporter ATP-binding protein [Actinoplanes digitatis]MBB4763369.1 ABC-2 type transport system ATP-binding protein [Actinoplanes digitatis]GID92189.1 ABC transporter ATP-binding protein [Actinoplanes digitatis]